MNERIKELAKEAQWYAECTTPQGLEWFDSFKEKYAELIIKECLNNMENCDGDLDFAIWKTKKDFGVK